MKIATCVHIIENGYVQFGYQYTWIEGFKGYGGKLKEGQTIRQNAVEEVWEETGGEPKFRLRPEEDGGIHIREEWLEPIGFIDFYNGSEEEVPFGDPSFRVYFFNCRKKLGRAVDTIEMKDHQLFNIHYPPVDKMIKGDGEFVPRMLQDICLIGWVRRDKDWNTTSSSIKECNKENLGF
ncbi:MAG: hypothetical protein AAB681_01280 [Patescibacteria group bacterium]